MKLMSSGINLNQLQRFGRFAFELDPRLLQLLRPRRMIPKETTLQIGVEFDTLAVLRYKG
jgi:hypothetical protein